MRAWKPGMPVEQPERGSRLFPVEVAKERQKELARRAEITNRRALAIFKKERWQDYEQIRAEVDEERGLLPGEPDPSEDPLLRMPRTPKSVWLKQ